jgi:2-polyprenyl-3-methyl-5-hydroxy-6-metoxy-1,4-benzoquinol methylase
MVADAYHEAVWASVPEGAQPADARLRRAFLLERVAAIARRDDRRLEAGVRVLDVGCGDGRLTAELARAGVSVVGVDVAAEALRRARETNPDLKLGLIPAEGPWPLEDSSFDVVWAGDTIEHVADTPAWLSEVRRVLRSGGTLLLSTPAHDRLLLVALALRPRRFEAHFDPRSDHLRF